MATENITIQVVVNDGQVSEAFKRVESQADRSSRRATRSVSTVTSGFRRLALAAAAAGTAIVAALFSRAAIRAAQEQENSVNRLNQSLANAGRFSEEASRSFQDFASEIQRTTTVGDEAVLQLAALANNFARTDEEAKRLTRAAIELSAATGQNLNSSLQVLGRTLSGEAGRLSQLGGEFVGLERAALESGRAIDIVLSRFGGAAAAEVRTFSGSFTQLKNVFGDLQEELGFFVTQSPVLIELFRQLTLAFSSVGERLGGLREGSDVLGVVIIQTIKLGEAINLFLIAPLEIVANAFNALFRSIQTGLNTVIAGIAASLNALGRFLPSRFRALQADLNAFSESSFELLGESADRTTDSFRNLFDVSFAGNTALFLEDLRIALENADEITKEFTNSTNELTGSLDAQEEKIFPIESAWESYGLVLQGVSEQLENLRNTAQTAFRQVGASAVQGLAQAGGQAFAAFGRAIATGEDALKNFGDALLSSIGQVAIQLGTTFILQGTAYTFAGIANGPALIGAGAALAAFGGILAGLGGGPATAPAAGSPGGPPLATSPVDDGIDLDEDVIERRPDTTVSVNIQGDVLDSDDTGLRIVNIINDAFDKQGVVVSRRGALA